MFQERLRTFIAIQNTLRTLTSELEKKARRLPDELLAGGRVEPGAHTPQIRTTRNGRDRKQRPTAR
jgi:hypothetical protein